MASNGSCFTVTWTNFKHKTGRPWHSECSQLLILSILSCVIHMIRIHWYNFWLRTQSQMTSHYTWGSVITLHVFGGVLGQPLDTFFWALTISWSQLLARVWSGPNKKRLLQKAHMAPAKVWSFVGMPPAFPPFNTHSTDHIILYVMCTRPKIGNHDGHQARDQADFERSFQNN